MTQTQPSRVDCPLGLFPIGLKRTGAYFYGTGNHYFMVNASSFAFGASTYQRFIHFNRPICANTVAAGPNHASTKLVQHLECSLITSQSQLTLKLHRRHTECLRRHQIRAQKPRLQWRPCRMHNRASRQGHIGATVSASNHPWSRCNALRLTIDAACRARESAWPPNPLQIVCTRHFAGKHPLKLKQ